MKQHSIYALCEPGTLDVRYVGRTNQPLHIRLGAHVSKAKVYQSHIGRWIASLAKDGKRPDCVLLTQCPSEMAADVEQAWIVLFIDNGYDMLNVRDCNNMGRGKVSGSTIKREQGFFDRLYDGLDRNDPEYGDKLMERTAARWHLSVNDFLTAARWMSANDTDMFKAIRHCFAIEAVFDYDA